MLVTSTMMNLRVLTTAALLCSQSIFLLRAESESSPRPAKAPDKPDIQALRSELEAMHETDQAQRAQMNRVRREHGADSPEMRKLWETQNQSDSHNIRRLEEIIAEIGWPKRSEVGDRAASAAFLILQHADLVYQKKYLPLTRAAVAANEMTPSSLALLEDRILLREGKKQIYGSQVAQNDAGQWEASNLEDPANVDRRRAAVGLGPLAEYLAGFAKRSGGTVNDGKGDAPAPDAPPLTQKLFDVGDTASIAYAKLRAVNPQAGPAGVELQFACRDFCARFPDSALYAAVRLLAARYWTWLRTPDLAQLGDWDPTAAEHDPKLNAEQRATVALEAAQARADRESGALGAWAEARFEAVAAAARVHLGTSIARERLIPPALDVAPDISRPVLRELYPNDAAVAAAINVIAMIGQPFEFQLTTLDGPTLSAGDFRGKVTMLLFAATESSYVDKLATELKQMVEKNGARDFAIALVGLDRTRSVTENFLQRNALEWPAQVDGSGWSTPLASRMLIRVVPYYLLLDRNGVLRYRGLAPASGEAAKRIAALVAEPPPRPIN